MDSAPKVWGRPFVKGHDPRRNRAGRRPHPLSAAIMTRLSARDAEDIVAVAIRQALDGDPVARAWLADRLEGKAIARNEQGDPGEFEQGADIRLTIVKGRKHPG